jgi:hypothetical protein
MTIRPWLLLLAMMGAAAGCASSDRCESDADCPVGAQCAVDTGQCQCATDEACEEGFRCNSQGTCQRAPGCLDNRDCEEDAFCDIRSGRCLPGPGLALMAECGLATQCPAGSTCLEGRCIEGCDDTGDCQLGEVCVGGTCSNAPNLCEDDSFCDFGSLCGVDQTCEDDTRGPYCRGCSPRTAQNPAPCGDARNFCLVNNRELAGATNICGVDCSNGQACPNGYFCSSVIVLTQQQCGTNAQCQCQPGNILPRSRSCQLDEPCVVLLPDGRPDPNAGGCVVEGEPECNGGVTGGPSACVVTIGETDGTCTCASDDQCPGDSVCVGGDCCTGPVDEGRQCVAGEGQLRGFCTCETDDDCLNDSCDALTGRCSVTGIPCEPGVTDCPNIQCRNGGCFIGENCAPEPGLACSQLR